MPDLAFFVKDDKGSFIMVNAPFLSMWGLRREEEVLGRKDRDFAPPYLAENFERDDQQVLQTGCAVVNRLELVNRRDDGTVHWHVTNKFPLTDKAGRAIGLAGTTRDLERTATSLQAYEELDEAVGYLLDHYRERIPVADLAARVNLSVSQFERRFKALFGTTPIKYQHRIRLQEACQQLIHTGKSIAAVAIDVGFYDHAHFTRHFVRQQGVTPAAFRNRYRRGS